MKSNDTAASYIEQVEVFQKTPKGARGSNPTAVLESDSRLIVPTGGLKLGLPLNSSGVFEAFPHCLPWGYEPVFLIAVLLGEVFPGQWFLNNRTAGSFGGLC